MKSRKCKRADNYCHCHCHIEGVTLSSIIRLCVVFTENPNKPFKPSDFKDKEGWKYDTVRKQLRRLTDYGIIGQLSDGSYQLKNRIKAYDFLKKDCDTSRYPSMTPPYRIRTKSHAISIAKVDLSGDALEWMLKMNMLTKPGPDDPARNVGFREGVAKTFNIRISLNTGSAVIYPKKKGWEKEYARIFSWDKDIASRFEGVSENMEFAVNYEDLKKINPLFENVPFEDIKGLVLEHNGMKITCCASQFEKDGELCIRSESLDDTMNVIDEVTYNLRGAMDRIAYDKRILSELQSLKRFMGDLPGAIAQAIQEAVKGGVVEGFNELNEQAKANQKPDDKIDVR